MLKLVSSYFFILFYTRAAWFDQLSQGSISGYLTQSQISNYFTSLNTSKQVFSLNIGPKTSGNNVIAAYYSKSTNTNSSSILITASHTTVQPFSVTMGLYLFGSILSSSESFWTYIRQNFNVYIVPAVNVDAWKAMETNNSLKKYLKNLRNTCQTNPGVNLNRNFGFQFDYNESSSGNDSCSDVYKGTSAFSEAETIMIQSLVKLVNKTSMWIHFDGVNNTIVFPWSYNQSLTDYGNDYFNTIYKNISDQLQDNYTVGNEPTLHKNSYGGGIVDYGLSQKIVTIMAGLEYTIPNSSNLTNVSLSHLNAFKVVLSQNLYPLKIKYISGSVREVIVNNISTFHSDLIFNLTNPSNAFVNSYLTLNCSNLNSNFSISISNSSRSLQASGAFTINIPIGGLQSLSQNVSLILVGGSSTSTFDISFKLGANTQYDPVSSPEQSSTFPFSDSTIFSRVWYKSSEHHEGVAVGLVSALFVIILAMIIAFIFISYKKIPEGEFEFDEDNGSGYSIKDFKGKEDHTITHQHGSGSNESDKDNSMSKLKPKNDEVANSFIPISVPKVEVKIEANYSAQDPSLRAAKQGVGVFDKSEPKPSLLSNREPPKPPIPAHKDSPHLPPNSLPKLFTAQAGAREVSVGPREVSLPIRNQGLDEEIKIPVLGSKNEDKEFEIRMSSSGVSKSSRSSCSSDDIQIIQDAKKNEIKFQMEVPQVRVEVNANPPVLAVGVPKGESHYTFNSDSNSSSSSSSSSKRNK